VFVCGCMTVFAWLNLNSTVFDDPLTDGCPTVLDGASRCLFVASSSGFNGCCEFKRGI